VRFANAISIAVVVAATATVVAQARPASERGESGERPRPPSAADDDERAFRPAHIHAAVAAGRYSDPRTAAWVSRVLIERRRKLLRWAFSRVAPLDRFSVRDRRGGFELCFEDLWVVAGLGEPLDEIEAESYDFAGRALGEIELEGEGRGRGARRCLGPVRAGAGRDSYTIVELEGERGGVELLPLYVHVARCRGGGFRVIGVDRR
jgi:hypothetical protein